MDEESDDDDDRLEKRNYKIFLPFISILFMSLISSIDVQSTANTPVLTSSHTAITNRRSLRQAQSAIVNSTSHQIKSPASNFSDKEIPKNVAKTVKTVLAEARSFTWDNGFVNYKFDNYTKDAEDKIVAAINSFQQMVNEGSKNGTCIQFHRIFNESEIEDNENYVKFFPGDKCDATVGKPFNEKNRNVSLGLHCIKNGTIQHELMHILGFWHEQSRTDRDNYVKIEWDHVLDRAKDNFRKYSDPENDHLGFPYDYGSIMHYDSKAFSKDGNETIVPVFGNSNIIGQRDAPSNLDLMKVRLRYNCAKHLNESVYRALLKYPIPLAADDNAPSPNLS